MLKKILCIMLSLVMIVGIFCAAASVAVAQELELDMAITYDLIPSSLKKADMSKGITRAELAGVCVKLYENFSGKKVTAPAKNSFTDTTDEDALKAYKLGVITGTSTDKFSPGQIQNREQVSTILTRTIKRSFIPGWTLANDENYTLDYKESVKFNDDAKMSEWAKPSVYFLAASGFVTFYNNNMFAPKGTASREFSLIIAIRAVEALKGEKLAYLGLSPGTIIASSSASPTPAPQTPAPTPKPPHTQTPTPPPATSADGIDPALLGQWLTGNVTSSLYDASTGRYIGIGTGIGSIYNYNADGTCWYLYCLKTSTMDSRIFATGEYTAKNGVIRITNLMLERSSDGGKTYKPPEKADSDTVLYYKITLDESGDEIMLSSFSYTSPEDDPNKARFRRVE